MIISYITNQITILFLQKEDIPSRSVIRRIANVFHALFVFGEIMRGGIRRQYRNIRFDIVFYIINILKSRIYKAKIILPKKCCSQFIKIRIDTFRKFNDRFVDYLGVHTTSLCVRVFAAQTRHRKWNFSIGFQTANFYHSYTMVVCEQQVQGFLLKFP